MGERKQEKLGWLGGWHGAFIWVLIVAIILLTRGQLLAGLAGLALLAVASAYIVYGAPWRHPARTYRQLLIPIYALIVVAVAWGIWAFDDPKYLGLNSYWSFLLILPVAMPLWLTGDRRWQDGEARDSQGTNKD
jgi:hypothetical protein